MQDGHDLGEMRLGVSACLMGDEVRYDGGHRRSPSLVVPLTLLAQYGELHEGTAVVGESYLFPHPKEQFLRNHVLCALSPGYGGDPGLTHGKGTLNMSGL